MFWQMALEQSDPFVIALSGTEGADSEQLIVVPDIGGARIYLTDLAASSAVLAQTATNARGELAANSITSLEPDSLTLSDDTKHIRVVSGQSFWFAWAGLYPDALVWTGDSRSTVAHS